MGIPQSSDEQAMCCYRFGTAQFDEASYELRVNGAVVDIQRKPLELLSLLLARAGIVVTREELLESVWNGRPIVDNVIANAITKLRSALGPENARQIITHPRVGYRFAGPLQSAPSSGTTIDQIDIRRGLSAPGRNDFILEHLLHGTSGHEVWTARHRHTGEQRVYKYCIERNQLDALKRETQLFRRLFATLGERADVARLLDWNFDTAPYFVEFEYGGASLAHWAETTPLGKLSGQERLNLFLQIADAIDAVHKAGIVHRDLHPANVLIAPGASATWQLRLTDFGNGAVLETDSGLQRTAQERAEQQAEPVGTSALYVAPEVLAGEAATTRSDIYALGILLYQFLIGDLRKPMAPGWERNIDDALLRNDLAQCADDDPLRRFASVEALTRSLRDLDARRARQIQQATVLANRQRRQHRNRLWRHALALLAIATIAMGITMALLR